MAEDASARIRSLLERERRQEEEQMKTGGKQQIHVIKRDADNPLFRTLQDTFQEVPSYNIQKPQSNSESVGGLMTVDQYKLAQQNAKMNRISNIAIQNKRSSDAISSSGDHLDTLAKRKADITAKKKMKNAFNPSALSFDEEIFELQNIEKIGIQKNKDVDTSFLPDKERQEQERLEKEKREREYEEEQERIMTQVLTVHYQFWDGAAHKKIVQCEKKTDLGQFLEKCRKQLASEFPECRNISSEGMLCVISEMIVPQTHSFYELEVLEARTSKTKQPLVPRESIEINTVRVVTRSWYERNKQLFPASRWTLFDMGKNT